jgi:hypothetical protein
VSRRLVFGGLLVVLVLVAGAGVYAFTSDPLEPGAGSVVANGVQAEGPDETGRFRYDFRFVPLEPIRWGLDVRNRSLVPVTIRGLDRSGEAPSALAIDQTLHLLAGDSMGVEPDQLRPFTPVELAPGAEVFLAVSERFTECASARQHWGVPGSALLRQELRLDVSVIGLARPARVTLPFDLAYDAPGGEGC